VRHAGAMTELELLERDDPRLTSTTELEAAVDLVRSSVLIASQHAVRDQVVAFLAEHPDAAERSCSEAHLTGSAVVLDATGSRTLLMLHRKLGRWFQPGGHADGDANLASVAWREATEETGIEGLRLAVPAIDLDVHRVAPPGEAPHLHLDLRFLVVAPAGSTEHGNEESLALRWVTSGDLDCLEPPVDASTRRLVGRGLGMGRALLT
jgi:8-oxo-dGTP pyrophosphatase MutT (NUDIX family)